MINYLFHFNRDEGTLLFLSFLAAIPIRSGSDACDTYLGLLLIATAIS
jgi:hypothetical protein